jgi:hypothetical protein
MPAQITVRELRVRVRDRTKRVRNLVLVTTLADGATYPADELRSLFRQRWNAEWPSRSKRTKNNAKREIALAQDSLAAPGRAASRWSLC